MFRVGIVGVEKGKFVPPHRV